MLNKTFNFAPCQTFKSLDELQHVHANFSFSEGGGRSDAGLSGQINGIYYNCIKCSG